MILQGLNHVQCYIDDILVTGADDDEHFHNLEEVLVRLRNYGIWVKSSKCTFSKVPLSTWDIRSQVRDFTQLPRR